MSVVFLGMFLVYASAEITSYEASNVNAAENGIVFDITDFRASVLQLLDLLMNVNFCHPYGTVAGAVA